MQTATITVKYLNPPKSPKGPASVKDANGTYWSFWTRDIPLDRFVVGGTYTVGYDTSQYNGKDQYTIKEVMDAGGQVTVVKPGAPLPSVPATNGHANGNGNGQRDEFIFVCGALNHAIGNGLELTVTNLVPTVQVLRDTYKQTFGK